MYGYYQQRGKNTGDTLKRIFLDRNVLSRLILINTAVFLLVTLVGLFGWLFRISSGTGLTLLGGVLALPSDLHALAVKPWTPFTYMFLHEGLLHWLFNMVMLYFGGALFLEYLSEKKLLWTYLLGGVTGALFFVGSFNLFPAFEHVKQIAVALGASASVLAIIIAIATYVPNYTVHLFLVGPVKMKYLALIFVALDVLSIQSGNPGGHIAHLGGALWGFVYALSLKRGNDFYGFLYKINLPDFDVFRTGKYRKFTTSRPDDGRPLSDEEYNKRRAATREEIDRILDKISKSGYASLTKAEKELLFKSSHKN